MMLSSKACQRWLTRSLNVAARSHAVASHRQRCIVSVEKTTNGRWLVRWRENGRQRGRRFLVKRDADAFDREIKRRQQLGPLALTQLTTRGPTLGEWIADHWAPEHGATLEQSTRERYADVYRLHIEPWLDGIQIGRAHVLN